jgi:sugar/nucleoside kinase (ribokinase family)
VFLANIQPSLQLSVLRQMRRRPRLVALDTMNYWIERTPKQLHRTLREIDVLVINDSEARQLAEEHNLLKAAARILALGPKMLVVKRGEYGALLMRVGSMFSVPAFPLEQVHDPTGAGDSFAGGFMGYLAKANRINDATLRRAMVYGSVMGSFVVERFGLGRLRTLTRAEINQRAREFLRLTRFQL